LLGLRRQKRNQGLLQFREHKWFWQEAARARIDHRFSDRLVLGDDQNRQRCLARTEAGVYVAMEQKTPLSEIV
jgi:hypothetical protein